ncbi:hypothetical protein OV450_5942 [Actinobacteria bacterium OV450]|nr:hypothetical protein OV450_5942 [Actinobacteria bacterium OV450]
MVRDDGRPEGRQFRTVGRTWGWLPEQLPHRLVLDGELFVSATEAGRLSFKRCSLCGIRDGASRLVETVPVLRVFRFAEYRDGPVQVRPFGPSARPASDGVLGAGVALEGVDVDTVLGVAVFLGKPGSQVRQGSASNAPSGMVEKCSIRSRTLRSPAGMVHGAPWVAARLRGNAPQCAPAMLRLRATAEAPRQGSAHASEIRVAGRLTDSRRMGCSLSTGVSRVECGRLFKVKQQWPCGS